MLRKFVIAAVILIIISPCRAWLPHGTYQNPYAKGVLNFGTNGLVPSNFVNIFKSCSLQVGTTSDVTLLDSYGYLTSAPTSNLAISCNGGAPAFYSGVHYRLKWPATRTFTITINGCSGGITLIKGSATTSGCAGFTGTISSVSGQEGEVDFILNSASFFFPTTGTYSVGSGEIALFRATDENLYNAGQYWTNDFVQEIRTVAPKVCRYMGLTMRGSQQNNEVMWNYRMQLQEIAWGDTLVPQTIMAGSSLGTGLLTISYNSGTNAYTAVAATDTPGSITANEMFIGIIPTTNNSPSPTLNIGGRGAVTLYNNNANAAPTNDLQAGKLYEFFYDSVLNAYVYSGNGASITSGIAASIPYEAFVQLSNLVGCDPWIVIPPMADDTYATNQASLVQNYLGSLLNAYFEYANEVWNTTSLTSWARKRGDAMGFTSTNNQDVYGYYGIRVRQIMSVDIPSVWNGGAAASNYFPVIAYQAAGDSNNLTNRFEGQQLCPVASGGACAGNSVYNAFTGSANWSTSPNRPIDAAKVLSLAPYAEGSNLCVDTLDAPCSLTSLQAPFYQSLVTAWEAGQTFTTQSMIDADIRNGLLAQQTVTASSTIFTTPSAHGFTANSTDVVFTVSGGTSYSGITTYTGTNASAVYRVTSTPTSTTFTVEPYASGFPFSGGGDTNAGTAGSGTLSVGISYGMTMLRLTSRWYAFAESNAERYNGGAGGSRPAGMGNLRLQAYEGGIELAGITSAQCTTLGITSSSDCATDIANAITDWKFSSFAAQSEWDYMKQFMGTYSGTSNFGLMTYAVSPANLILNGGSVWALVSGYTPSFAPYQLYYGFQNFNTNP